MALTNEQKYAIADKIALGYGKSLDRLISGDSKRYIAFGIIINTANANGETLSSKLGEDDATHVTNLVIQRLSQAHSLVIDAF